MIEVQLVDAQDQPTGTMEKIEAHRLGLLHRALSVIIVNSQKELLLQRRANAKYHSPGLWTNTCCSHPYPAELPLAAANRRLKEEMGMDTDLEYVFKFLYKVDFENGLIEHELDHVFVGQSDENPKLNPEEAMDFKWVSITALEKNMNENPEAYTFWFKLIIQSYGDSLKSYL
ncbi:MAG: isopentenyl-diphosphate Delta-isomerase [Crocinitomicaceae bacterium]|tara:strand:- start:7980 stop:8498 length:519 start_codon:yes stop_codon:yes gene_type:complete